MWIEDCPLADIAKAVGTPCYVYSAATLARHYHVFKQGLTGMDALIAYSVKANSNLAVLALLSKLGAGADVVSGGELARALRAGIPAKNRVFWCRKNTFGNASRAGNRYSAIQCRICT